MSFFDDYVADGCCCAACGTYIGGEEPGHPRYCSAACAGDAFKADDRRQPRVPSYRPPPRKQSKAKGDKVPCPQCQRLVSPVGLKHHQIDKHGGIV